MTLPLLPRAPRPVADAGEGDIAARAQELTRAWAAELIATQPLERSAGMPLERLCAQVPALCERILAALGSDAELRALRDSSPQGLACLGELAGASDLEGQLAAVESLRGVCWRGLIAGLTQPTAPEVAELADRLGHVFWLVTLAVAGRGEGPRAAQPHLPITDAAAVTAPREAQIEIHDARREGPGAWLRAIGGYLERHAERGLPFAVVLVEVIGIERLRHVEDPAVLGRLVGEVQDALDGELRAADSLTRESEGRYWVIAPHADQEQARELAERLIARVRRSVNHRDAPIEVAVGIALCPEDGRDAGELTSCADMRLFAARADGVPLAGGDAFGGPSPAP